MNPFYNTEGDLSVQLAPWQLERMGKPMSRALFRLERPLGFRSFLAGGDITVPTGFVSDLASIPQFAWSIFMSPDDPRIELGGWVHDWLYRNSGKVKVRWMESEDVAERWLNRKQCDMILAFEAMPALGASSFQQWAVYLALRMFGGMAWGGERP